MYVYVCIYIYPHSGGGVDDGITRGDLIKSYFTYTDIHRHRYTHTDTQTHTYISIHIYIYIDKYLAI